MAIPENKNELIGAIEISFEKLMRTIDQVPWERSDEKSMEGHAQGTMMSPSDLLGYLIGWNELVLKWLADDDAGRDIEFPIEGYQWNELGQLAQKFYRDYDNLSFEDKTRQFRLCKEELLENLQLRSNDELYADPWYRKHTKGRMIQLNTSSPYSNANARLRKWLKS